MTDEIQTEEAEAEELKLNDFGEAFIAGRSRRNAQRALDAADAVEVDQILVHAVRDGYFAPPAVVEKYAELLEAELAEEAAFREAELAEAEAQAEREREAAQNPDEPVTAVVGEAGPEAVVPLGTGPADEAAGDATIAPAGTEGVEIPEGNPTPKGNVAQINAWAAQQSPPIAFAEGAVKADKLRAIDAAVNNKEE
jgi:hypothetical protein